MKARSALTPFLFTSRLGKTAATMTRPRSNTSMRYTHGQAWRFCCKLRAHVALVRAFAVSGCQMALPAALPAVAHGPYSLGLVHSAEP